MKKESVERDYYTVYILIYYKGKRLLHPQIRFFLCLNEILEIRHICERFLTENALYIHVNSTKPSPRIKLPIKIQKQIRNRRNELWLLFFYVCTITFLYMDDVLKYLFKSSLLSCIHVPETVGVEAWVVTDDTGREVFQEKLGCGNQQIKPQGIQNYSF